MHALQLYHSSPLAHAFPSGVVRTRRYLGAWSLQVLIVPISFPVEPVLYLSACSLSLARDTAVSPRMAAILNIACLMYVRGTTGV